MADENETLSTEVGSSSTSNEDNSDQNQGNDGLESSSESLNGSEGSGGNIEQKVPYARLKEKVDETNSLKAEREALVKELEEYKQWDTAHKLIKSKFESPEAYNKALEDSRIAEEQAEVAEQVRIEAQSRNLDEETANNLFQTKLVRKEFDKTKSELDKVLREQKLTLARTQFPEMDEDTVLAIAKSDGSDLLSIAKRSHEREQSKTALAVEVALARYNAEKTKTKETVPPEGTGGRMVQADRCPDPKTDRKGWEAWWKAKGAPVSY